MAKNKKKASAENGGSRSQQRVVRCCATCADWLPQMMECRYAKDEAAPPEAVCDGWRENLNPHQYWHDWANATAPNATS